MKWLVPKLTTAQRTGLTLEESEIVFDTDLDVFYSGDGVTLGGKAVSGAAAWGSITGTLSSQTDLQTALNLKANLNSPTFTGTVTLPASQVVNGVTLQTGGSASLYLNQQGSYVAASGGVSDGDKGDITVSGSGTVWTIDNDVVTYAKMQNVGANSVLARAAASSGDVSEVSLTASQLLGRGSTGDVAAITLGTNLSMSGTTLNATGGGTPAGSTTQVQFNNAGAFGADADFTYNSTTNTLTVAGEVVTGNIQTNSSGGGRLQTNGGSDALGWGFGGSVNGTLYGGWDYDAGTADRILSLNGTKTITALDTATYPNLTELSYVKGVSSAIQTQLNARSTASFTTIAVSGQSDVVADSTADTLTLVAGSNVTITTNAGTDTITIASTGGGSSTFDAIGSGTNTTAAMVVGTGSSLAASGSGTIVATDVANASVISKVLTAFTSGAGVVAATDTILQAFQKIVGNIAGLMIPNGIFGDGSDGNVTISSGTTTLTRDMFYSNLTINGTGILATAGFKVYVSGTLDISAAAEGSIINNGNNGNNGAASATGGTAASSSGSGTTLQVGSLQAGGAGGAAAGTAAANAGAVTGAIGGGHPVGGAGGLGSGGAGGAGSTAATPTIAGFSLRRYICDFIRLTGGTVGAYTTARNCSGGGGGGDGTAGGGGGSGGAYGCAVVIYARTIARGTNVNTAIIRARGGTGGSGGSPVAGNRGGGGGGSGGAGGFIYICYGFLTGSTIVNALDASGGAGGNGGNGFGTGVGGAGGGRGGGGRIVLVDMVAGTGSELAPDNGAAGGAASGVTGGTGAVQVLKQKDL